MSHGEAIDSSTERLRTLNERGGIIVGYLYPHTPIELILAHGLTPSLIRVSPIVSSGFEDSLQTFSCAFSRNIFSQRARGGFVEFDGFLFPGNTCDALQNVGDVWKQRFPKDKVFRLTYPVSSYSAGSIDFFTEELKILSAAIAEIYGKPFSPTDYAAAVSLVNDFRHAAQFLYASRIINPATISYSDLVELVTHFLIAPEQQVLDDADERVAAAESILKEHDQVALTENLMRGLIASNLTDISLEKAITGPRLLVVGGMVDPQNLAGLFAGLENSSDDVVGLDLLSFSFKSVFTPEVGPKGDPFRSMAESILRAPAEPTQEGLTQRTTYLKELMRSIPFDGLVVCEQSFCDPDEFETPSLLRAADDVGIPSLRLPIDPEISDRGRLVGRLQTFLETLEG
ncbi:MAG: 2-hydroxyacyl-CoA dehydratase subunit D [Candidatus Thorarchaeota archaeon]